MAPLPDAPACSCCFGELHRVVRAHVSAHEIERVAHPGAAGTLKLAKVASGLHVTISTPISARGYVESVRRRDVTAMSFAFRALDDTWRLVDGIPIREVVDAQISEVSAVAFPAYRSTTLGAGADGTGRALDLARRQLQTLLTR
jgi:HK97 family phage prohead protease